MTGENSSNLSSREDDCLLERRLEKKYDSLDMNAPHTLKQEMYYQHSISAQTQVKEVSRTRINPTRLIDPCLCWKSKAECQCMTEDFKAKVGGSQDPRRRGILFGSSESQIYSEVNYVPKNYHSSVPAFPMVDGLVQPAENRSLSDSKLSETEEKMKCDVFSLPQLDSGASDLSLGRYSLSPKSWSVEEETLAKESRRKSSLSLSLYPSLFSYMSSDEKITLYRSKSCEFLSVSSTGEWPRSNSSDSAVIVENNSKSSPKSCSIPSSPSSSSTEKPLETLQIVSSISKPISLPNSLKIKEFSEENVKLRRNSSWSSLPSSVKHARTPSVVISDHSSLDVSFHVAIASDDFPPDMMSSSTSSPDGCFCKTPAECPICSTARMFESTEWRDAFYDTSMSNHLQRRFSNCSTSSYLTASEDEVEVSLVCPSPPPERKKSNWGKLRNVVHWTPFIQTYKRQKYPWVQLAGHQGNFKAGHKPGTIMKKLCPAEEKAFEILQNDVLRPFVPEYIGTIEGSDGDRYLQLQDLLSDFATPCVMDIKMGVRTYLEEELAKARHKPKLRKDMYDKMIQIDSKAPTEAEHRAKAVTKPRYMVWRETISSTATLGFRIEGVRRGDGTSSKDFKTTRTREQVVSVLSSFIDGYSNAVVSYIQSLRDIQSTLQRSEFFKTHELIGSSLLFVHNEKKAEVSLIDFAKTIPLPDSVRVTHRVPWVEGAHEDGYLIGLDNLIEIFEGLQAKFRPKGGTVQEDKTIANAQTNVSLGLSNDVNCAEGALQNAESLLSHNPKKHPLETTPCPNEHVMKKHTSTDVTPNAKPSLTHVHKNKNVAGVIEQKYWTSANTEKKAN